MSKSNDGGPAFPTKKTLHVSHEDGQAETGFVEMRGMSLRDFFAGQFLVGALASPGLIEGRRETGPTKYAEIAYIYADAMLEAREK